MSFMQSDWMYLVWFGTFTVGICLAGWIEERSAKWRNRK